MVINLKTSTLLDEKTIIRLRANKNFDKMKLGTLIFFITKKGNKRCCFINQSKI